MIYCQNGYGGEWGFTLVYEKYIYTIMSPSEFIRLMFKRETVSMMNCYHITVVNLYQLPFEMSWNGSRDTLRGFQLVLSAMFLQFLGEKRY